MSRRKKRRIQGEVELNLAAMLDMAFQLLTFFILTFKPAPIEGQVSLRMPPPQPISNPNATKAAGSDTDSSDVAKGLDTLVVSVFANRQGEIASLGVGEAQVGTTAQLNNKLQTLLADPAIHFEQVLIQVSGDLLYGELMRVVEVCTQQKLSDGSKLSKLSFVELPGTNSGGG